MSVQEGAAPGGSSAPRPGGSTGQKVVGQPDDLNLELFRTIAETGRMHVQRCADCGLYSHPPRYYCRRCFSARGEIVPVSGRGTVYSFTVSHSTTESAWRDEVPYATVVVELDEGPRIVGAAQGLADPSTAIRIGQRARVLPERRTAEFAYFTVRLVDTTEEGGEHERA